MIRFGSRVDVYLPLSAQVLAGLDQAAVAGETVIADLKGEGGAAALQGGVSRGTKAAFRRRPPHSAGLPKTRRKIVSTCLKW